jgi:CCR4-NOT transcriptional regulation complex NOT5 subunit
MIYSELIKLVGQYMTYSEFKRENPEIDLTEKDWYSMLEGNTMRTNKTDLRNRYLNDFEQDWSNRRKVAFEILDHGKEASN